MIIVKKYISDRHAPLASRIKGDIDIKYDYDETKEIILQRFEVEAVPAFTKPDGNKLFPLDDQIIKFLFEQINNLTQTVGQMINFRVMEQILHDAIQESLEQNLPKVELNVVEKIYNEYKSDIQSKTGSKIKLSPETRNEIDKAIGGEDQNTANCLYLNGIKTAMTLWEALPDGKEYSSVESEGASAAQIIDKHRIFISSISLALTSQGEKIQKNIISK